MHNNHMAHGNSTPLTTSTTCPTCNTFFARVPCERDEAGAYAVLEVTPCAECGALLCGCCSRVVCDSCGQTVCSEHAQEIDGLKCCSACHAGIAAQPIETFCCPACTGTALRGERVEMSEPGYRDVAYRFTCLACGETGHEDELVRVVIEAASVTPKPAQRETRIAAVNTKAEVA